MKKIAIIVCACILLSLCAFADSSNASSYTGQALVFRNNSTSCLVRGQLTDIKSDGKTAAAYVTPDKAYFMVPLNFVCNLMGWRCVEYSDSCDVTTGKLTYGYYYGENYVYIHGKPYTLKGAVYCQKKAGVVYVSASCVSMMLGCGMDSCYSPAGKAFVAASAKDSALCAEAVASIPYEKPQYTGYLALTFDDGPSGDLTERLLDGLAERNAHATFFICNYRIASFSSPMSRYIAEGHEVGNHSANHTILSTVSSSTVCKELDTTSRSIYDYTGVTPTLMRPPGGGYNNTVLNAAANRGLSCIMWSVDPQDWSVLNAKKVADHIIANAGDGDIILLHDMYSTSVDAALQVVDYFTEKGYAFVTVSELAAIKGYDLTPGQVYSSFK